MDEEVATPGYYSVKLRESDIKAELTVSKKAAVHRYNFKEKDEHSPPYFGKADWKEIALALKEVDYQGVFNLELTLYRYMTFNKIGLQELLTFIRKISNVDNMVK